MARTVGLATSRRPRLRSRADALRPAGFGTLDPPTGVAKECFSVHSCPHGSTMNTVSFKEVLARLPRGEPLDTADLKAESITTFRASALARSGWLLHLARGVYMIPGDTLTRDGSLAFLTRRFAGLHVGGRTALDWRGVRQNLAFEETLTLWGERPGRLPVWFLDRFPARYQATSLFDHTLPAGTGIGPLPGGRSDVAVSVPERAFLELLSDVGKTQSLEEARQLSESLGNLRVPVLDQLLAHTTRIKVLRLAQMLAAELDLPWAASAERHSRRVGGGKRWISVARTGERIDLRRR